MAMETNDIFMVGDRVRFLPYDRIVLAAKHIGVSDSDTKVILDRISKQSAKTRISTIKSLWCIHYDAEWGRYPNTDWMRVDLTDGPDYIGYPDWCFEIIDDNDNVVHSGRFPFVYLNKLAEIQQKSQQEYGKQYEQQQREIENYKWKYDYKTDTEYRDSADGKRIYRTCGEFWNRY